MEFKQSATMLMQPQLPVTVIVRSGRPEASTSLPPLQVFQLDSRHSARHYNLSGAFELDSPLEQLETIPQSKVLELVQLLLQLQGLLLRSICMFPYSQPC